MESGIRHVCFITHHPPGHHHAHPYPSIAKTAVLRRAACLPASCVSLRCRSGGLDVGWVPVWVPVWVNLAESLGTKRPSLGGNYGTRYMSSSLVVSHLQLRGRDAAGWFPPGLWWCVTQLCASVAS